MKHFLFFNSRSMVFYSLEPGVMHRILYFTAPIRINHEEDLHDLRG